MLAGAMVECSKHNCMLSGGHSVAGEEASFGLSVTGILSEQAKTSLSTTKIAGQNYHLILTKPIGIGVILAAQMNGSASGHAISAAIEAMAESNAPPARILLANGTIAMTDITGFGLLGHGSNLLAQKQFSGAILYLDDIPVIEGALALSRKGIASSLFPQNKAAQSFEIDHASISDKNYLSVIDLLFDPQTSGGILALVPENRVEICLAALHAEGVAAKTVGIATDSVSGWVFRQRNI